MSDTPVDFSAPAVLRKWPSVNKERVSASLGARPYMIIDGTLDECIQKIMLQPESQRHLYEIHTEAQSDLVSTILSGDHVIELARLRNLLGK
jgi:peptidyl-tRNA hydrolase